MKAFTLHKGLVVGIDRSNVDTDMIIPKQFLKSIKRSGFGQNLFDELRYMDEGKPGGDCKSRILRDDFPLNYPRYTGASILLTQENFGCGSSREHAPWAIEDYGFRVIIAPSFADIFFTNCLKNGLLPIVLNKKIVNYIFDQVKIIEGYQLSVDLKKQVVITPSSDEFFFDIDEFSKRALLEGLDEIGLTLKKADLIYTYEAEHMKNAPWIFGAIK